MVIDAHQHFWIFDPVRDSWIDDSMKAIQKDFLPKNLKPILDANSIDGCVVVQSDQTEIENLFQLTNALQNDFVKGVVGWVDLRSKKIEEKLAHYSYYSKMKGFRHILQGEKDRALMLKKAFMNGISLLEKYNFTYDILVYPKQLKDAVFIARSCPDTQFVLDHMAKPLIKEGKVTQWANYMKELSENPNIVCKVSGMVTEADYANWKKEDFYIYLDVVLNSFGTDRLLYGSDWPVCLVAATYGEQLDILESYFRELSQNEKDKIFGQNAVRIYRL